MLTFATDSAVAFIARYSNCINDKHVEHSVRHLVGIFDCFVSAKLYLDQLKFDKVIEETKEYTFCVAQR